jgi:hypothetical protein
VWQKATPLKNATMNDHEYLPQQRATPEPISIVRQLPERGFLQLVGLAPGAAVLAVGVDMLLFAEDVISLGLLVPLSVVAAGALGFCTYKLQRKWGDDHDAAIVKAVVIGLVTAIPVPVTPLLAGPAGLAGLIRNALKR